MIQIRNEIRPIRDEDTETLVTIWLEASRFAHGFLGEERLQLQSEQVRDIYLKQAENWVILEDGRPAGFIGLLDQFIGGLFIDPQIHGKGLGRQLLDHSLQLKKSLELEVYALNTQAHSIYLRNQFIETARQPTDAEGLPFAVIHMRRDL
ncbi:GNAT family N-acetyltransferase [Pseudochrobactrum sp. sp1633]|uniref:GNAT family N-acetyltransferase n=1 Tax=Pseudochrobactrum sp. sp1633 TaxID=3036706 RepID=UPI0025A5BCF2|nr:GNAT family N-acetyltransferase [Pseudochrobactrum sp. sp1633]MDM8345351.1 GNAT family N-acetyltransferase [Pseudochrobactrum sp. sp1633]